MVSLLGVEQETVGRKARFSGATGTRLSGSHRPRFVEAAFGRWGDRAAVGMHVGFGGCYPATGLPIGTQHNAHPRTPCQKAT